eukprot:c32381_g1_i1.p2 GENE.c32381_g1_i1~~c32381_g1_i1.p2  ORF type:complete len:224 (-),score=34.01 c32381_g1_i1:538-1209(-)
MARLVGNGMGAEMQDFVMGTDPANATDISAKTPANAIPITLEIGATNTASVQAFAVDEGRVPVKEVFCRACAILDSPGLRAATSRLHFAHITAVDLGAAMLEYAIVLAPLALIVQRCFPPAYVHGDTVLTPVASVLPALTVIYVITLAQIWHAKHRRIAPISTFAVVLEYAINFRGETFSAAPALKDLVVPIAQLLNQWLPVQIFARDMASAISLKTRTAFAG